MMLQAAEPIIDTHIHLFNTERPEGVPWPDKKDAVLYHAALPPRYWKIAEPLGVTGAVAVEASPWLEDNQWLLNTAATDPRILGIVGNIEPGKPEFRRQLDRFHRNRLFRGIRYGNLWDRDFTAGVANPACIADLKALAQAGLSMDTANPDSALLRGVLRLNDQVPDLRIVVDHLARLDPWNVREVEELGKRPEIYIKVSGVLRRVNGNVPRDPAFYRDRLDTIWGIFGEDRLIYGSDWPNSDQWAPYPDELRVVNAYFTGKGPAARGKYFSGNARKVYGV